MKKFSFQQKDKYNPLEFLVSEIIPKLTEATKGLVQVEALSYDGPIYSYTKGKNNMATISSFLTPNEEVIDIQNELGELSKDEKTYELILKVKGFEDYKYRILFFRFGRTGYPVNVVLERSIAQEINPEGDDRYVYKCNSMDELSLLIKKIVDSEEFYQVVQRAIYLSLKKHEERNVAPIQTKTIKYVQKKKS